jgi:thioredoxin-related protein
MHANYSDDIEIIAVNVGIGDSVENAKEYAKKHALPYKVIFSNDIASQYRVQGTPTQIAIDINGKIAYRGINIPRDFSKKDVKKLLKK